MNNINDQLIEKYKLLHEILENQFKYLKEKYEADLKLNILQIQKEALLNIINELQSKNIVSKTSESEIEHQKSMIKKPESENESKQQKLVTKSAFNMQPTVTSKTNE